MVAGSPWTAPELDANKEREEAARDHANEVATEEAIEAQKDVDFAFV